MVVCSVQEHMIFRVCHWPSVSNQGIHSQPLSLPSQWVEINLEPHFTDLEGDNCSESHLPDISTSSEGEHRVHFATSAFICTHYLPSSTLRHHCFNWNMESRTSSKSCSHQNWRAHCKPKVLLSQQRIFILLRYVQIASFEVLLITDPPGQLSNSVSSIAAISPQDQVPSDAPNKETPNQIDTPDLATVDAAHEDASHWSKDSTLDIVFATQLSVGGRYTVLLGQHVPPVALPGIWSPPYPQIQTMSTSI